MSVGDVFAFTFDRYINPLYLVATSDYSFRISYCDPINFGIIFAENTNFISNTITSCKAKSE